MLSLSDVTVDYPVKDGFFSAVNRVSFDVREGEVFALVGESGAGKTTLALSLLGLLPDARREGAALFGGRDLFGMSGGELRQLMGREAGMVFQDPYRSFDPVYRIGRQIGEVLDAHLELSREEKRLRVEEALESVGLTAGRISRLYPHEMSGGMLQRAQLAAALCCRPPLLIADEPTSALDTTVQAQITGLLTRLKREKKLTLFIITHDLGVVAALADRAAVMTGGEIVECGAVSEIFARPSHPFTQKLLKANLAYR